MTDYEFTNDWFEKTARPIWDHAIPRIRPERVLEIGSYEGRSTCYLIDALSLQRPLEIHCVDTWEGGAEHQKAGEDMAAVKARFDANTERAIQAAKHDVTLVVRRETTATALPRLLQPEGVGPGYFDFVYVDGSHEACDVLHDAVLAFRLLKTGGHMAFDDYTWRLPQGGVERAPKLAIDAFTSAYARKLAILPLPATQMWIMKLAD